VVDTPDDWPDVTFTLAVEGGRVTINCLGFDRVEGSGPITFGLARGVLARLPSLIAKAVTEALDEKLADGSYALTASKQTIASVLGNMPRRRGQVTDDRLGQALALFDEGGVHAVADGLAVSTSQAYRILQRARAELQPDDNQSEETKR
jgi:hypothetical protein